MTNEEAEKALAKWKSFMNNDEPLNLVLRQLQRLEYQIRTTWEMQKWLQEIKCTL